MSIPHSQPYPVKICFLKDKPRSQSANQQKVSLSFLSSFIQQQKLSKDKDMQTNSQLLITSTNLENKVKTFKDQQNIRIRNKKGIAYQKWKLKKSVSHCQDQRYLTNIIGKDWFLNENKQGLLIDYKSKTTIRDKLESFRQYKRVENNNELMKNQFNEFLLTKTKSFTQTEDKNVQSVITKIDERKLKHPRPKNMRNRIDLIKRQSGQQKRPRTLDSRDRRIYTDMVGFRWSFVDDNKRFQLNNDLK